MTRRKLAAAVALGRKGGAAATPAQAAAGRVNGRKGGRPAVTHYACRECQNTIARGEDGGEKWSCPDHPDAGVDSIAAAAGLVDGGKPKAGP